MWVYVTLVLLSKHIITLRECFAQRKIPLSYRSKMWMFPENPHTALPNFETVHMETQARESMEIPPSFSTEAEAAVLGSRKSCLTTPGCVCTWALHRCRALLCPPQASPGSAGQKDSTCSPVLRGGAVLRYFLKLAKMLYGRNSSGLVKPWAHEDREM